MFEHYFSTATASYLALNYTLYIESNSNPLFAQEPKLIESLGVESAVKQNLVSTTSTDHQTL